MDDSTSDCQLNQGEVDYEFESNEVSEPLSVVDDQFVPKVGMTFTTLEDAGKFYRNYAKAADFSTRVRSTNRKGNEIKNQLIISSREGKWKSKISPTEKTNPTAGLNCPARIYIHTLKDVGAWIISKVVLDHSDPCCPNKAEMLKQHRELSMSIRRTIENNEEAGYSVYDVGEQVSSSIFNKFVVTYDSVAVKVKCQCLLFESRGILCRHALSVLSFEQVSQVSPRYILERWSKKVKRRHTHIKSSHDEPLLEPRSKRFDQLVFRSQNICEFASESEELTAILHRTYDNIMAEMESSKAKRKGTSSLSHEDANLESINLFDAASVVHSNSSQYQGHVMNYQFKVPAVGDNSLGV
ncbi:hypothetical protein Ahy_B08g093552 [Arachis hypogaea]|uniref:SWIM-type domain-containing protein n=1 Tax=Arachis hypogaea TaxID=3818 RepID=A0A444Y6C3_ARAHY|nr:hypothetical protein Ahy_B08g093552 [Arachis hypogaea]